MLLEEPPMLVLPSLARSIGLGESIVLQQLYFLLRHPQNGKVLGDGERYIFNTYEQWRRDHFTFFTLHTLRRIFETLEEKGLVVSCQPEGPISRRKYYRLGMGAITKLTFQALEEAENDHVSKLDTSKGPNWTVPLTESTIKEEKEKSSRPVPSAGLPVGEKTFQTPNSPSIQEVMLYANAVNVSLAIARRFFCVNEFNGWQTVTTHTKRAQPIRNWKLALVAFSNKDSTRKPKEDKTNNEEFWAWAKTTFNEDQMPHVKDWVGQAMRRKYKQRNRINGDMEPIADFRASVTGYVKWCEENGVYARSD